MLKCTLAFVGVCQRQAFSGWEMDVGIKLSDLGNVKNLSSYDFVSEGKPRVRGGGDHSYNIRKFGFLQCTVRSIKHYFSGKDRRNEIMQMRRVALRDLEDYQPIVDACDHDSVCNEGVKKEIESKLTELRKNHGTSKKFFTEVQELVRFAENEGIAFSGSKRSMWTSQSDSLRTSECSRYIRADGWDMKFAGGERKGFQVPGKANGPATDKMSGRAALECMTSVLLADGELRRSVGKENSGEHPVGGDVERKGITEKQERLCTAMAFLKFLTVEKHGNKTENLFKWSGPNDVADAEKSKFAATAFWGIVKPERSSVDSPPPNLKILVPEKRLQRHVVELLDKFPYEAGKGVAIDKRKLREILKSSDGKGEPLTKVEQRWVTKELFKFAK